MNYPRKLTVIFAKNLYQHQITNSEELTFMVLKIKHIVSNSYAKPIIKVIWNESWKDFQLNTDKDYVNFENFYKSYLQLN